MSPTTTTRDDLSWGGRDKVGLLPPTRIVFFLRPDPESSFVCSRVRRRGLNPTKQRNEFGVVK